MDGVGGGGGMRMVATYLRRVGMVVKTQDGNILMAGKRVSRQPVWKVMLAAPTLRANSRWGDSP